MSGERLAENLNRAMHTAMARHPNLFFLGEDIADPYGGAFKVARGLTTAFPDRARTTPISENAILGMATGLALSGAKAIAEVMFGDFLALAIDPLMNLASKSVTMYGQRHPVPLVVRCPTGGNRGYGPTHSQCLQKHVLGIPNLDLYEVSPFHDSVPLLEELLSLERPVVLFEDKQLYAQRMRLDFEDELFSARALPTANGFVRVTSPHFRKPQGLLVAHGGMALKCVDAMRELFLEDELEVELLVPSRLYPMVFDGEAASAIREAKRVFTVEESTEGGGWGCEVARHVHDLAWSSLAGPVRVLTSRPEIIPAAPHLERKVLLQKEGIKAAVREVLLG